MLEILVKTLYTVILVAIAGVCVREVYQVWWDDTLQYGQFAATKDGADASATGDSFRRLIVQQQRVLYGLFKSERSRAGEFRFRNDDLPIGAVTDLGNIPTSLLDELKIEAAGINVSSVLSILRRGIKPPNEITGSVDELQNVFYVAAQWRQSPKRDGSGTEARTFAPPSLSTIDAASFDLACRIFLARVASQHPVLRAAEEDDFCTFARGLFVFRSYATDRDHALTDEDKTKAGEQLAKAAAGIDGLIAAKTGLPYVYKLGAYIDIERLNLAPSAEPAKVKDVLDQAERRFKEYIERLAKLDPNAQDVDVQERLVFLASRRGKLDNPQQLAAATNVSQFVTASGPAFSAIIRTVPSADGPQPAAAVALHPGVSIGAAKGARAGTLCCIVKDAADKKYILTVGHVVGPVGEGVVSPATIENAKSHPVGVVTKTFSGLALVEVPPGLRVGNGDIKLWAPSVNAGDQVSLIGRTSKMRTGKVRDVHFSARIETPGTDSLPSTDLILTERISLAGDSGAPVLDSEGRLVGMLIAGSDSASVVLPLKPILDANGLSLP
jgi:hypothetical protein